MHQSDLHDKTTNKHARPGPNTESIPPSQLAIQDECEAAKAQLNRELDAVLEVAIPLFHKVAILFQKAADIGEKSSFENIEAEFQRVEEIQASMYVLDSSATSELEVLITKASNLRREHAQGIAEIERLISDAVSGNVRSTF